MNIRELLSMLTAKNFAEIQESHQKEFNSEMHYRQAVVEFQRGQMTAEEFRQALGVYGPRIDWNNLYAIAKYNRSLLQEPVELAD